MRKKFSGQVRFLCSHRGLRPVKRHQLCVGRATGHGYTLKMLEPLPDEYFMREALRQAQKAYAAKEVPVGAVVVREGKIVARAYNQVELLKDATAHAEMLAIRAAAQALGSERLTECELHVTLEPCAMCAAAISFARIRRLYYGAPDPKGGAVDSGVRFFSSPTCHHRPEVYGGISEAASATLLREFFAARR